MAWASKEEEAMNIVKLHMGVMDYEQKKKTCKIYTQLFFPELDNTWSNVQWVTLQGVTYVTMWDHEHLLRNIKFAMIAEMLGVGPYKYCIITNLMPYFENRLALLMGYLPRQKMCFYPTLYVLRGPFQRAPWRSWGQMISHRRNLFRNPFIRTIYHTQQFVIFLQTGCYEGSFWP